MQYIFYTGVAFAWLGSSFLFIGYLSHLFLDECISENLAGEPVELPYGGTFQVIGFGNWIAFLILYSVFPVKKPILILVFKKILLARS